jgi:hypothetical protein
MVIGKILFEAIGNLSSLLLDAIQGSSRPTLINDYREERLTCLAWPKSSLDRHA